jgi:phage recombination protein Bet
MSSNNIVKTENSVSDAVVIDYLKSMNLNVNDVNAKKFINIAKSFGLNPFKKEIYAVSYKNNFNIIVGYEVYIKRAERTGKLAGWKAWTEGSIQNGDLKACVEIKRKDWNDPFYHEVYFDEYNQNNMIWNSKPRTMIKKVAIAQGFRLAFPDELGGIPYTSDEIDETIEEVEVVKEEKKDNSLQLMSNILEAEGLTTKEAKTLFVKHMQTKYNQNLRDEAVMKEFLKEPLKLKQHIRHFLDEINKEG